VLGARTHDTVDESKVVDLVLHPGDVSIHHPNIVHGSKANNSDTRRCGLTLRYMPTSVQCFKEDQPVLLMQGEAVDGVNFYRSWPKYREGYDMPFSGAQKWNQNRFVNPEDEAYFERTDFQQVDAEIEAEINDFIDQLGGR